MKKLNLNRESYRNFITDQLSKTYQLTIEEKPNNLIICKFLKTGETQAQINIYENKDGSTTIQSAVGQNQELSKQIAEKLIEISAVKEFRSHSFYIKSIRDEDFENLVELIVEYYGNIIENDNSIDRKRIIKIKGKQGDKIVITKHSNNAFQVQGKPMLLFNEIIEVLSEFMTFEEIIEQQLSFYETNLTSADIRGELELKLPKTFNLIEDKLKIIMTPSLALQKISIELEDYSAFAFPILRTIEGVLKQILLKYNKKVDYKEGFKSYFSKKHLDFVLNVEFEKEINNQNISRKLCKLYKYYNVYRHSLFHIDEEIITSKVISLQEAESIVATSLTIIDDCHDCF